MPDADKCFLNIPFKTYLVSLADSILPDGTLDPAKLKLAGQREFENYKAIERRVNASGCGGEGGCCSDVFSGNGSAASIASGATSTITSNALSSFSIWPAYTSDSAVTLQAGTWVVTGTVNYDVTTAPTSGTVGATNPITSPVPQGGQYAGVGGPALANSNAGFAFTGLMIYGSTWQPRLIVGNGYNVTITSVGVKFQAHRICDPCAYELGPGPG